MLFQNNFILPVLPLSSEIRRDAVCIISIIVIPVTIIVHIKEIISIIGISRAQPPISKQIVTSTNSAIIIGTPISKIIQNKF